MRKTIFMYTSIVACCIASLPIFGASFMEAFKEIPLLDAKSLSGYEVAISRPFEITTVNTQKQAVFDLEDTLRSLATEGESSINDTRAISMFTKLNQLAFQANEKCFSLIRRTIV